MHDADAGVHDDRYPTGFSASGGLLVRDAGLQPQGLRADRDRLVRERRRLLGTPEDNPLIGFLSQRHFLAFTPQAGVFPGTGPVALLPTPAATGRADRVTPLLAAIETVAATDARPWRSVWIEYPDTNEGKALSTLARALTARGESSGQTGARPRFAKISRVAFEKLSV